MRDCWILNWGYNLESSVFVVNPYSEQHSVWTGASCGWKILAEREAAFLGQMQAPAYCFSAEWSSLLALSPQLLGNCRIQLKQGGMLFINTSQEQTRKGTCVCLGSEFTFFSWGVPSPVQELRLWFQIWWNRWLSHYWAQGISSGGGGSLSSLCWAMALLAWVCCQC